EMMLEFSVKDSGIGLTGEELSKLFQPFTQADNSTTRKYGGTGLGLSISRQLVELMAGSIGVVSEVGKGSTFSFTVKCQTLAPKSELPESRSALLQNRRVLVVDDDEDFLRVMRLRLSNWNMRVLLAANATECLLALTTAAREGDPIEVVLIDWKMPGADGLEVARRIRREMGEGLTPKMILVTAYRDARLGEAEFLRDFSIVVHKPVAPLVLFDALTKLIEPASARKTIGRAPDLGKKRILLVEDDELNQEVALGILEPTGAKVSVANNGKEAIAALSREPFDAVLMDLQMPVMGGLEATQLLRREPAFANLPIIAMTASAMAGERERLMEAGMSDYLAKPINVAGLYNTLAKWLDPQSDQRRIKDLFQ
ncbi:MAG: response regulator, partial [Burkholderiales bacterium]